MRHTFLFQEGLWRAVGTFTDADGQTLPAEGETRIIHEKARWLVDGRMKVSYPEAKEFHSRYEVAPFLPNRPDTTWKAENPDLGNFVGRMSVVEDTIISTYHTEDGACSGVECLTRIGDAAYRARGVLFRREMILSCWALELIKTE